MTDETRKLIEEADRLVALAPDTALSDALYGAVRARGLEESDADCILDRIADYASIAGRLAAALRESEERLTTATIAISSLTAEIADRERRLDEVATYEKQIFRAADEKHQSSTFSAVMRCRERRDKAMTDAAALRADLRATAKALVIARQVMPEYDYVYGFFPGGDPRMFSPDEESSTAEEREAHKAACARWDAGDTAPKTPHEYGPHGDTAKAEPGVRVLLAGFGLGSYRYKSEASEIADAALARPGVRRAAEEE